jgi:hypothetical protein
MKLRSEKFDDDDNNNNNNTKECQLMFFFWVSALLWMNVPVFWRNVLPPFSVDTEVGEKHREVAGMGEG